ncbi:MAG: 16S rRNA (cytosine(1402)-N(4))-methyltransferase RsmH [Gemmatimonadetes bacterium]|uniref:Ribosomal RNA small subunit methyltransferase H n=1 Tax=Candidatus Kutchimonas denitrificans TaxID=3056748 RepID=A0AAE4Z9B5_9BACT|nr:16S rRNA (cytosine(1402)-N(4))-methyltransferase RsmH [Gemmatimonadota bacterium]NIR74541.1 16S rRNA (cytosine(1402)-N(4))-methyltransferase RsmH [Candidatus Kutchimonas denitrificans]NIS02731.1 16S rRNA (cytosine(1402)-N(4))-methyltransferase RsmH [Gemmatimonadota bacterium]NIT68892.1 16S rRNA (cytosine(1402)-N(4))-methyltransferase RsmH [Gemmatimonadota bacterium]NIU52197.1 16S rRNA (cytosine(1402)-N(4))-methyltransferase RsmH [Gemmatimonadota bacterium]
MELGRDIEVATIVTESSYHEAVMVDQVLEALEPDRGGVYLDGTVGGGGHAAALLEASADARLLGIDRDDEALAAARARLAPFGDRVQLERGDYAEASELFDLGEGALAGVLLDLGVSSRQVDSSERGFSFRPDTPLDMRMSGEGPSAADLLNTLEAEELAAIFRDYGEQRRAGQLAREVVARRERAPFGRSDDLLAAMEAVYRKPVRATDAAPVFQALRIAVNRELESLERALPTLRDRLAPGGRMVVLAYHSLEDRRVKRAFREWSRDCICPPELPECRCRGRALGRELVKRPLRPSTEEVARNPRARSARLRAWERGE